MEESLDYINDALVDLVQTLSKLSKKRQEDLSFSSIKYIEKILLRLAEQALIQPRSKIVEPEQSSDKLVSKLSKESIILHWIPLLGVLGDMCGDLR